MKEPLSQNLASIVDSMIPCFMFENCSSQNIYSPSLVQLKGPNVLITLSLDYDSAPFVMEMRLEIVPFKRSDISHERRHPLQFT